MNLIDGEVVNMHDVLADIMGAKGILNVPPDIAIDALRKTAIDFCTQSTIWEFRNQFPMQFNVADYPIEVPEGSRVASMRWVAVNGYRLIPNTRGYIAHWTGMRSLDPNSYYGSGQGYTFTMDGREWFFVTPRPVDSCCCDHVEWCAALKPTQNSCVLARVLIEDWNDGLTSGTAYRLFSMPKQDWTNAGLAMQNRREYQNWIARARLTKAQNFTQAPLVATGSYF